MFRINNPAHDVHCAKKGIVYKKNLSNYGPKNKDAILNRRPFHEIILKRAW